MKYTYCIRTDVVTDDENKRFTVYGVNALDSKNNLIKAIPDMFFNRCEAESFIIRCNAKRLDVSMLSSCAEEEVARRYTI